MNIGISNPEVVISQGTDSERDTIDSRISDRFMGTFDQADHMGE